MTEEAPSICVPRPTAQSKKINLKSDRGATDSAVISKLCLSGKENICVRNHPAKNAAASSLSFF